MHQPSFMHHWCPHLCPSFSIGDYIVDFGTIKRERGGLWLKIFHTGIQMDVNRLTHQKNARGLRTVDAAHQTQNEHLEYNLLYNSLSPRRSNQGAKFHQKKVYLRHLFSICRLSFFKLMSRKTDLFLL